MAPIRARFLSLLLTTVHGAKERVGLLEHGLLGNGVVVPSPEGGQVGRRQLPLPNRIDPPDEEPSSLLGPRHREPQLDEVDAVTGEELLEHRGLLKE